MVCRAGHPVVRCVGPPAFSPSPADPLPPAHLVRAVAADAEPTEYASPQTLKVSAEAPKDVDPARSPANLRMSESLAFSANGEQGVRYCPL